MKRAGIRPPVWLTADMHYTAAHHDDPNRAQFRDFEPFWEFVSGPLHAGTWSPGILDNTFGPKAVYQKGCSAGQGDNLAPCFGLQFFGHVAIGLGGRQDRAGGRVDEGEFLCVRRGSRDAAGKGQRGKAHEDDLQAAPPAP